MYLPTLVLALATLPSLISSTTFTLGPEDANLVSGSGCALTYSDDFCSTCSGFYPFSVQNCEDIVQQAEASSAGGIAVYGDICGGQLEIVFLQSGEITVDLAVGASCGVGCDIFLDQDASCSA